MEEHANERQLSKDEAAHIIDQARLIPGIAVSFYKVFPFSRKDIDALQTLVRETLAGKYGLQPSEINACNIGLKPRRWKADEQVVDLKLNYHTKKGSEIVEQGFGIGRLEAHILGEQHTIAEVLNKDWSAVDLPGEYRLWLPNTARDPQPVAREILRYQDAVRQIISPTSAYRHVRAA